MGGRWEEDDGTEELLVTEKQMSTWIREVRLEGVLQENDAYTGRCIVNQEAENYREATIIPSCRNCSIFNHPVGVISLGVTWILL